MRKKTTNEFIEDAKKIHSDKYDYSLVSYINNKTKIKIICPIHGIFEQIPIYHINKKCGCPKCKFEKLKKLFSHSKEYFIEKSKINHRNKYDYSLVKYINNRTKVKIICPVHGVFEQTPFKHVNRGCQLCGGTSKNTIDNFIEKAKKIHNNKYDYSLVEYINNKSNIKIICKEHGIFEQTPSKHINSKQGCPICGESKGEREIRDILTDNNIEYISQKKFDNCKYFRPLPFDFYLPNYNICIEFNGIQHHEPIPFFGGIDAHNKQIIKDNIKEEFCINNNIKLIKIGQNESVKNKLNFIFSL